MINPPKKLCRNCNKNLPHTWRRECVTCIKLKEREKAKLAQAKQKANSRINVRIQGVDERDRDSLREKIKETVWPFLKTRQISIKVSKGKVKTNLQKLEKKADDLWSIAVKLNYGNCCQYCWTTENLNSHHIFTRSRRATRWDIYNGICLCANNHTFSQVFSAHKTPAKFKEWFVWVKWEKHYDDLERKSQQVFKVTEEFLLEKIKELEEFIEKNWF